jgi:hypothetical protein
MQLQTGAGKMNFNCLSPCDDFFGFRLVYTVHVCHNVAVIYILTGCNRLVKFTALVCFLKLSMTTWLKKC